MCCEPWLATDTPDFLAVAQHLRASGVYVPRIYGVSPPHGLMCLEDFGDLTLAACWHTAPAATRVHWGIRAIDELVKMHTLGTQRHDLSCPAFHIAFDVPKLLSELQFFDSGTPHSPRLSGRPLMRRACHSVPC
jgi:aminoglycoside/choline kinase family phosphotransferase